VKLAHSLLWLAACVCVGAYSALAEQPREPAVFSGPQAGERLRSFEAVLVYGERAGKTVDVIQLSQNRPTMLIVVNGSNRPAARLSRILMNFAEMRGAKLFAAVVYLDGDQSAATEQLQRAVSWWKVAGPVGVSVDGADGPGGYGFNRNVNVTVLVASEGRVTANFALKQPSETDAPKILKQVVSLVGGRVPGAAETTWLSFPTAKPAGAKYRSASADVEFRSLMCDLLAARDADSAARAARSIEAYAAKQDRRRDALKNAANMMLEGRARPVTRQHPARRHLARWKQAK
jgi:hypothetical protein